jgi:hypothetical protein
MIMHPFSSTLPLVSDRWRFLFLLFLALLRRLARNIPLSFLALLRRRARSAPLLTLLRPRTWRRPSFSILSDPCPSPVPLQPQYLRVLLVPPTP